MPLDRGDDRGRQPFGHPLFFEPPNGENQRSTVIQERREADALGVGLGRQTVLGRHAVLDMVKDRFHFLHARHGVPVVEGRFAAEERMRLLEPLTGAFGAGERL